MLTIGAIVWGVRDLPRAINFWSHALNYQQLGATPINSNDEPHAGYIVLADPDGNPFCVIQLQPPPLLHLFIDN